MSEGVIDPFGRLDVALADARALDDQDLLDAICDLERRKRSVEAQSAVLVTEMNRRIEHLGYLVSGSADTLAVLLAISGRSADHQLDAGVALCSRPLVWDALQSGRIDRTKASRIVDELADVPDPAREQLELIALEYAQTHTAHQLRRRLLELTCEHDPDEELRDQAVDKRGVWITPRGHGMADVYAYLSAEHAEAFAQALQQLADSPDCADPYEQGDARTADQRRADALVGFLAAHTTWQVNVDVVIGADALIGDNDLTAHVKRLGPIGSDLARDLCFSPDARWRRLVTDPLDWSAHRHVGHVLPDTRANPQCCQSAGCDLPVPRLPSTGGILRH